MKKIFNSLYIMNQANHSYEDGGRRVAVIMTCYSLLVSIVYLVNKNPIFHEVIYQSILFESIIFNFWHYNKSQKWLTTFYILSLCMVSWLLPHSSWPFVWTINNTQNQRLFFFTVECSCKFKRNKKYNPSK